MTDSDAARLGLNKVCTSVMRTMRKSHGINLAWVKNQLDRMNVTLLRVDTTMNLADLATKPVTVETFERLVTLLGML